MNILLTGSLEKSLIWAKDLNWKQFNRSNSSFVDSNGEQVLNVSSFVDLIGNDIGKIYICDSFFYRKDIYVILKELSFRTEHERVIGLINFFAERQVIEIPKKLTRWEKIKAFFSGDFEIKWT